MNGLPPCTGRMIRKSAFGRTQLFLPSQSVIFREVKCTGGLLRHDCANVYHVLPELFTCDHSVACWHCCESIQNAKRTAIPLPRVYDSSENIFHVYGITCSPGCAKAYILEHATFDRGQHINLLIKMLREVYDVNYAVIETPPRACMRRFGGYFDPGQLPRVECKLVQPPFVSYTMLAEERIGVDTPAITTTLEEADTFDEPPPPAMFDEFLADRAPVLARDQPKKRKTATTSSERGKPCGPMAKFVKDKS